MNVATYEEPGRMIWNALLHIVYDRLVCYFSYDTLMAKEQESLWPVHYRVSREDSGIPENAEGTLSSAIKVPIAFLQCVQILTHETLRKKDVFYDFYKPTKIPYKALFLTHFKKEKGDWASYPLWRQSGIMVTATLVD